MRSSSQPPEDSIAPGSSDANGNGDLLTDDNWVVIQRNQNS